MATEIFTSEYEFSHGHKPRGRGLWVLFVRIFATCDGPLVKPQEISFQHNGTYGEAIRACKRAMRAEEHRDFEIRVGS